MTPQEHLDKAEQLLVEAAEIEKGPRSHLAKGLALLAIGHAMAALARSVDVGLTPGAFGATTYSRVAGTVERIAHDATVHVLPTTVRCPGCNAPTASGGVRDEQGNVWCLRCHSSGIPQQAAAEAGQP